MKITALLPSLVLLSACGAEGETDERTMLLGEIEICLNQASAGALLDDARASAAVDTCAEQISSYSRYNIEEAFGRRLVPDDLEMMGFFNEHRGAFRKFAIRKLTTGEGEWQ